MILPPFQLGHTQLDYTNINLISIVYYVNNMNIDILNTFNPWWTNGAVPIQLLGSHRRPILEEVETYVDKRFITLIYGLRRVGKTTCLYQVIDSLLRNGTVPLQIIYFSFDEKSGEPNDVITTYAEKVLKKSIRDAGRIFVFMDEIQKVPEWQSKLKIIYDLYPNIKFFLSGSASVSLQKHATESLAGRMIGVFVKPLTFSEFLEWKKIPVDKTRPELFQGQIAPHLMDYLRKGGFPEIVHEEGDELIRKYVKNAVLEHIIYRDIPQEFGAKDVELLRTLLELFVKDPGMMMNTERISRDLGRNKITVGNYIEYLKHALLIREVKNLRSNLLVSSRKNKKIYPTSSAFCFAYRDDFFADKILEKIAEVTVAEYLQAENYYCNGFEVDFVQKSDKDTVPIEVKYGAPDEHQIRKFMEKFGVEKGILVSKDSLRQGDLQVVPLWLFLLG